MTIYVKKKLHTQLFKWQLHSKTMKLEELFKVCNMPWQLIGSATMDFVASQNFEKAKKLN